MYRFSAAESTTTYSRPVTTVTTLNSKTISIKPLLTSTLALKTTTEIHAVTQTTSTFTTANISRFDIQNSTYSYNNGCRHSFSTILNVYGVLCCYFLSLYVDKSKCRYVNTKFRIYETFKKSFLIKLLLCVYGFCLWHCLS